MRLMSLAGLSPPLLGMLKHFAGTGWAGDILPLSFKKAAFMEI